MNRKVILIALFFASLVGIFTIGNSEALDCDKIDSSFSISGVNVKNICTSVHEGMKQESGGYCSWMKVNFDRLGDISECCSKVGDYLLQRDLYQSGERDCYMAFAVSKQDETICDKKSKDINFGDNYCYRAVAEVKRNESICEKIHNDAAQKAGCIFDIAILKKDPNVCMSIENPLNIQDCGFIGPSYCYVFNNDICVAAVKGDKTLCEDVKALTSEYDADAKNSCYEVVSQK